MFVLASIGRVLDLLKSDHCTCIACRDGAIHASDCAVHNGSALPFGPCDCGALARAEVTALRELAAELRAEAVSDLRLLDAADSDGGGCD